MVAGGNIVTAEMVEKDFKEAIKKLEQGQHNTERFVESTISNNQYFKELGKDLLPAILMGVDDMYTDALEAMKGLMHRAVQSARISEMSAVYHKAMIDHMIIRHDQQMKSQVLSSTKNEEKLTEVCNDLSLSKQEVLCAKEHVYHVKKELVDTRELYQKILEERNQLKQKLGQIREALD